MTSPAVPDLTRLEELAEKATRGPWKRRIWRGGKRPVSMVMTPHGCLWNDWDGLNSDDDGDFIAAMRNTVPSLLAAYRAVERVRALHEPIRPPQTLDGATINYPCGCGGFWPCPTIRALDGETDG